MKKLGGTGNRNSNITCMEYQGRKETTEKGIADLLALNAESSFKPLDEPEENENGQRPKWPLTWHKGKLISEHSMDQTSSHQSSHHHISKIRN